ncbi:MAG: hypothetical protein ABWY00_00285 [Dongiaceae bacterium]
MKIASTVYLALATVIAGSALSVSASYAQGYPNDSQRCASSPIDACTHKDTDRRAGGVDSAPNDRVHTSEHADRE